MTNNVAVLVEGLKACGMDLGNPNIGRVDNMNAKKLQDELDKYKRSYKQIVDRNTQLEERFEVQEDRIAVLTSSLEQCQKAVDMNKKLLRQMGEEHGRKEQGLVSFMNRLKDKLREIGYADFNNLGD